MSDAIWINTLSQWSIDFSSSLGVPDVPDAGRIPGGGVLSVSNDGVAPPPQDSYTFALQKVLGTDGTNKAQST